MSEKSTHVIARIRHANGNDTNDVIELTDPTTQHGEAVAQITHSFRTHNRDNPDDVKELIDLDLLAPGDEKRKGVNRPSPADIPATPTDTSVLAAQRNAVEAAGAKAAIVGSPDPAEIVAAADETKTTYGNENLPLSAFDGKSDEEILSHKGIGRPTLDRIRRDQAKARAKQQAIPPVNRPAPVTPQVNPAPAPKK